MKESGLAEGSISISHPGGIESESAFHRAGRVHRGSEYMIGIALSAIQIKSPCSL
jgi:hypothetical protein